MLNKSIKLLPLPPCTPVPFKLNFTSECFLSALHKIYGLIFFLERRFINCTCLRSAFLTDQKTPNPLCNAKPPYLVHYSSGDKRVRGIIRKTPIPDSITEHKYSWFIFFFFKWKLVFSCVVIRKKHRNWTVNGFWLLHTVFLLTRPFDVTGDVNNNVFPIWFRCKDVETISTFESQYKFGSTDFYPVLFTCS